MAAPFASPTFPLAFDHRASFERVDFGASARVAAEVHRWIVRAEDLIFAANQPEVRAGAPLDHAGILVDEEFGTEVARRVMQAGVPLATAVQHSGQDEFDFEYGEDFVRHVETVDPTFVKVLVRYNPGGHSELNRRQAERLGGLSGWLSANHRLFLFELLLAATTSHLEAFEGHRDDYDLHPRPTLVVDILATLQAAGVEPDVCKIEGFDSADDATALVAQARAGGRDAVDCIVFERGASWDKVVGWLRVGPGVDGYVRFAVARTLWRGALGPHLAGKASDEQMLREIAPRYRDLIDLYDGARTLRGMP